MAGLDLAQAMLGLASKKAPQSWLVQGKAGALPWSDRASERVFCVNAFHHFSDQESFIAEAYRVLRPGGGIMTVGLDPHTGLDRWWVYDYFPQVIEIDKKRYLPASQIRRMMADAGFVGCRTVVAQHTPWRMPARTALEIGRLDRSYTSQLTVLTGDEYNQGINHLVGKLEVTEARKGVLHVSADLRLYATIGWVG